MIPFNNKKINKIRINHRNKRFFQIISIINCQKKVFKEYIFENKHQKFYKLLNLIIHNYFYFIFFIIKI